MRRLLTVAILITLAGTLSPSDAGIANGGTVVGRVTSVRTYSEGGEQWDQSARVLFIGRFTFGTVAWHGSVAGVIRATITNDGVTVFPFTLRGTSPINGALRMDCKLLARSDGLSSVPNTVSQYFVAGSYTDRASCLGKVGGISARRPLRWEYVWEFLLTGCSRNPCTVHTRFAGAFRQQ